MAAHHAKYIRHATVAPPHVDPRLRWGAKLLGGAMWFFILYRIKEEGPVMFGQKLPFEHH